MVSSVYEKLSELANNHSLMELSDISAEHKRLFIRGEKMNPTILGVLFFIIGIALVYLLIYFIVHAKIIAI